MKRFRKKWWVVTAGAFIVLAPTGCSKKEQQTSLPPSQPAPAGKVAEASPPGTGAPLQAPPSDIWISETTGREYRVRVEKERLYAEWVDMPSALFQHGAYIRTECRRVGKQWVGTSHSYLPCTAGDAGKEQVSNWCRILTKIEFESVTAERITGRGEGLKRFDCKNCKVLETRWLNFAWVHKRGVARAETLSPANKPKGLEEASQP